MTITSGLPEPSCYTLYRSGRNFNQAMKRLRKKGVSISPMALKLMQSTGFATAKGSHSEPKEMVIQHIPLGLVLEEEKKEPLTTWANILERLTLGGIPSLRADVILDYAVQMSETNFPPGSCVLFLMGAIPYEMRAPNGMVVSGQGPGYLIHSYVFVYSLAPVFSPGPGEYQIDVWPIDDVSLIGPNVWAVAGTEWQEENRQLPRPLCDPPHRPSPALLAAMLGAPVTLDVPSRPKPYVLTTTVEEEGMRSGYLWHQTRGTMKGSGPHRVGLSTLGWQMLQHVKRELKGQHLLGDGL